MAPGNAIPAASDFPGLRLYEERVSAPDESPVGTPFADLGGDAVGAEGGAGSKEHGYEMGTRSVSSLNQLSDPYGFVHTKLSALAPSPD